MMFYVSLMETTKQKSTVHIQKRKESKHTTTENHQITKTAREEERSKGSIKHLRNN